MRGTKGIEDNEEEFEEEFEEEPEDDDEEGMSQAQKTRKPRKTNATMRTINKDGKSIIDNSQTTFQGTKQIQNNQQLSNQNSQNIQIQNQPNNQFQQNSNQNQARNTKKSQRKTRTYYNLDDEQAEEEYYDEEEEYEEDMGTQKDGLSRLSDSMIRTPEIQSMVSTQNGINVYNNKLKNKDQDYYNKLYSMPSKPQPLGHEDYFRKIKQRKTGVPIKVKMPRNIEEQEYNSDLPVILDPLLGETNKSLKTYKDAIPSFLPNEKKYQKFMKNLNKDEEEIQNKLKGRVANDDPYDIKRRRIPAYQDPFEQHMQKMEDNTLNGIKQARADSQISPHDSLYKVHQLNSSQYSQGNSRRGGGFLSVQRNRDQFPKLNSGLNENQNNISLPQIRDQIGGMEKKMERELDKEAKLKKDAKRLIGHALGKNIPELDRTVKAWLKKDQKPAYINEMGPIYTLEYKNMIDKERNNGYQISPIIDKQLRKAHFNNLEGVQNNLLVLKDKFKDENQKRIDFLQKKQEQNINFNYAQIKQVYNVSLLDQHLGTPEAYLLKKKDDAKQTIQHVFKRKFEEKLIFQELNDPKTLRKDRIRLEEKLRMINIAVELAKQRLEWLLYDTPFTIQQLEEEVKNQKAGIYVENGDEHKKLKEMAKDYKIDREKYEEIQRKARDGRNLLGIQVLEARALKNRTGCDSISDFILLYREFQHIERQQDLQVLLQDALLNKKKAQSFYDFLKKIVEFEDETVKIKNEFQDNQIDQNRLEQDQFYNYDEIALEKTKLEDKDEFVVQFKLEKIIFQFIPYWYVPINSESDKLSSDLRQLLKFDILTSKTITAFLNCATLDEMMTYARHNRRMKEFVVFEKEEMQFLIREHRIPEQIIRNFAQLMIIIQKEYLMVPSMVFQLAKPTKIQEINFSNFQAMHLTSDAIVSILTCIELHQEHVKRIIFQNCEMDNNKAKLFKDLLSNPNKPIQSCNFERNQISDAGLDHIVQALKVNPKGDLRILKFSNNKLSIQAAIRLSHVLKKRPPELRPLNLQVLKMSHNEIGNIGTETLASFIKKNSILKYLDLSFNNIGDRGLLAISDCLLENERMEVLNMLGNDFTEKSLGSLGNSLVENQKLKLIILKLGNINSDKQGFLNFINNGFMVSKKIRYLYLNTPYFNESSIRQINEGYLPKVYSATERHDERIDSSVLLDFMCQIVENQLFEGGNNQRIIRYGEKLLKEIIQQKFELNNIEILIYLFDNIFGPDHILKDNLSPFHLFAKHGQIEAMSYCLKLGISPNFKTSIAFNEYPSATALHLASGYSQLETCQHLLKYGIEVDNKDLNGNTALHYAAVQGALQLSQLLVTNGASCLVMNKKDMLPMHSCIFSDNLSCWRFILGETEKQKKLQFLGKQIEKTIDIKTYQGFTPLMLALEEDAENIFQYLIDADADLKAQDEEGNTILHRAILLKNQRKAKVVIKRGANIHVRSFAGETPIMMAVRFGLIEVVRSLVNAGADLYEKNFKEDSLLHLAARTDQADIIGYLLDKGLNTSERNREGMRPADLAVRPGIKEMLSHPNNRHNLYTDQNLNQRGVKLNRNHAPSIASESEDEEANTKNNKQKLNPNQRAKLLNEQMLKYKLDHKEVFGETFAKKYQGYDAAKITEDRFKYDRKDNEVDQKIKVQDGAAGYGDDDDNEYGEELDEGEYDEEDEEEDEDEIQDRKTYPKKRQTGGNQQLKTQNQNKTLQQSQANKSNQQLPSKTQKTGKNLKVSAGFRGTVDVSLNNTRNNIDQQQKIQQDKIQRALGGSKQNPQNLNTTKRKIQQQEDEEEMYRGDQDDGEDGEEDGEEFEEDEEWASATRKQEKTKHIEAKRGR